MYPKMFLLKKGGEKKKNSSTILKTVDSCGSMHLEEVSEFIVLLLDWEYKYS